MKILEGLIKINQKIKFDYGARSWYKTRPFGHLASLLLQLASKQENNGATSWIWVPPSPSPSSIPIFVYKKYNFNNRVNYTLSVLPLHLFLILDFCLAFSDSIEAWGRTVTGWWWFCCCFVSSTNLQRRPFQSRPCSGSTISTLSPRCLVTTFLLLLLLQFLYHLLLLFFLHQTYYLHACSSSSF